MMVYSSGIEGENQDANGGLHVEVTEDYLDDPDSKPGNMQARVQGGGPKGPGPPPLEIEKQKKKKKKKKRSSEQILSYFTYILLLF